MWLKVSESEKKNFSLLSFANRKGTTEGNFPDFLILGPQRTGTTWLADNIRFHPEIFMSNPKELYFFSRLGKNRKYSVELNHLVRTLRGKARFTHRSTFREILKVTYYDLLLTGRYKAYELEWYLRHFNLHNLLSRVHARKIKVLYGETYRPIRFGEATASYAAMDPEQIQEVVKLNPDVKALLIVRNPIDRAWSHATKDLIRDSPNSPQKVSDDQFIDFFREEYIMRCGQYSTQIANWKKYLHAENLLVINYNDLEHDPRKLLKRVFEFIGVSTEEKYISDKLDEVVNPSSNNKAIPAKAKEFLTSAYSDEIKWIKDNLGITV